MEQDHKRESIDRENYQQNIDNLTNPLPNVEILTPEECGMLYRNLQYHWISRGDNYVETKKLIERLYRRWMGISNV